MKLGLVVCLAGVALGAVAALPLQDPPKAKDEPNPMGDPAAMARAMQAMQPGTEHKELAGMVGKWKTDVAYTMTAGAPPMEWSGTSTFTMLMDGRYLQEDHESSGPMGPYKGRSTTGFNNMTKQYESTWIDSMGTGIVYLSGAADASGDVKLKGEFMEPMTNAMMGMRNVMHKVGADEYEARMYFTPAGKPEFQAMTMKYTRQP